MICRTYGVCQRDLKRQEKHYLCIRHVPLTREKTVARLRFACELSDDSKHNTRLRKTSPLYTTSCLPAIDIIHPEKTMNLLVRRVRFSCFVPLRGISPPTPSLLNRHMPSLRWSQPDLNMPRPSKTSLQIPSFAYLNTFRTGTISSHVLPIGHAKYKTKPGLMPPAQEYSSHQEYTTVFAKPGLEKGGMNAVKRYSQAIGSNHTSFNVEYHAETSVLPTLCIHIPHEC
jgi:hypothetical protein